MLHKGIKDKICSARLCDNKAKYAIVWSNPSIHLNRQKIWLACEQHREFLSNYIAIRNFPYEIKNADEV